MFSLKRITYNNLGSARIGQGVDTIQSASIGWGSWRSGTRADSGNYMPISFVPHQNTFYCTLPYDDVEQGQFKPEAQNVGPWFKQIHAEPGSVMARQQPEETAWKSPAHPAAVEPSHAATSSDERVMSPSAPTRETEVAEQKTAANQAATKPVQAHRALAKSVIPASAAKAVTTYAPRPN